MKKSGIIAALTVVALIIGAWGLFGPAVNPDSKKYFYIHTGSGFSAVKDSLISQHIISNGFWFTLLSKAALYDRRVKPGRYDISEIHNTFSLVRKLRSGIQAPVRLTINKLRSRAELAGKIARKLENDSLEIIRFLYNNDSLASMGVDTNTALSIVIPNTYLYYWNTDFRIVLRNLKLQQNYFWNDQRKKNAADLGLTPTQAYILASIVEEETNYKDDKGLIASVYLNRIARGMKLEADPTVRFAVGDFSMQRVLHEHLAIESPFNTYRNTGLPPGPICTPSINTIDAVLHAPRTDYIFFVASPDFSGRSAFSSDYAGHLRHAARYRKVLDSLLGTRKNIR